jgi:hypothetical protein
VFSLVEVNNAAPRSYGVGVQGGWTGAMGVVVIFLCVQEGEWDALYIQRLAAALNHRTTRLHESLLPNRQVGAVGREMKRARPAHPFEIGFSSVKRYARA